MSADSADPCGTQFARVDLTRAVIGQFFEVRRDLKPGYPEFVYREAMVIALSDAGMAVDREVPVDVNFRGRRIAGFRLDLIVERVLVVELKAVASLATAHRDQLVNYLRCTNLELGLLLNFGPKAEVRRVAFSNDRKPGLRA
jgi:GxxExxY protein